MTITIEIPSQLDILKRSECDCDTLTITNSSLASSLVEPSLLNDTATEGESSNYNREMTLRKKERQQRQQQQQQQHQHLRKTNETRGTKTISNNNSNPFSFFNPSNFVNIGPSGSSSSSDRKKSLLPITLAEVQSHNNIEDGVWIVCGTSVYDVTDYMGHHPGGIKSILRRSGGADCTRDMKFHSLNAVKLWKSMKIGYLVPSPGDDDKCTINKKHNDSSKMSDKDIDDVRSTFMSSSNGTSAAMNYEKHFLAQTEKCTIS